MPSLPSLPSSDPSSQVRIARRLGLSLLLSLAAAAPSLPALAIQSTLVPSLMPDSQGTANLGQEGTPSLVASSKNKSKNKSKSKQKGKSKKKGSDDNSKSKSKSKGSDDKSRSSTTVMTTDIASLVSLPQPVI
jgi:hypothetical protein